MEHWALSSVMNLLMGLMIKVIYMQLYIGIYRIGDTNGIVKLSSRLVGLTVLIEYLTVPLEYIDTILLTIGWKVKKIGWTCFIVPTLAALLVNTGCSYSYQLQLIAS